MREHLAKKTALALFCWLAFVAQGAEPGAPEGMALVPAGSFRPFFQAEQDPSRIPVDAFWLDTRPVTNGDYLQFVRAHRKWRRSEVVRLFADSDYLKNWEGDLELGARAPAEAPVTYVSWFAARAYAAWKDKRLPTTAEWEFAAAASATKPDGEKDPAFVQTIRRWYSTPAPETLPPVGQGPANLYGLHDLHGLVWEWVSDFSTALVTGDARGDTGIDRKLFCGGGSQGARDRTDFPAFMRYGFRSSLRASYTVHNLGFRCAKTLNP